MTRVIPTASSNLCGKAREAGRDEIDELRHEEIGENQQHQLREREQGEDAAGEQAGGRVALGRQKPGIGRHIRGIERALAEDGAELVGQAQRDEIGVRQGPRTHQRADDHLAQEPGQAGKRGEAADGEELREHVAL